MEQEPSPEGPPGVPRWVYVFVGVAAAGIAAFALLHPAGLGFGPHMHG